MVRSESSPRLPTAKALPFLLLEMRRQWPVSGPVSSRVPLSRRLGARPRPRALNSPAGRYHGQHSWGAPPDRLRTDPAATNQLLAGVTSLSRPLLSVGRLLRKLLRAPWYLLGGCCLMTSHRHSQRDREGSAELCNPSWEPLQTHQVPKAVCSPVARRL